MKQVPLTQGQFAIIDDEDYEFITQWKWFAMKKKRGYKTIFYAARRSTKIVNGVRRRCMIWMHREINKTSNNSLTDHKDGNGLNNIRSNLRDATQRQNSRNVKSAYGVSKYKGVHWDKQKNKWRASIRIDGRLKCLGRYYNEEDAANAYNVAAKSEFGDFYSKGMRE